MKTVKDSLNLSFIDFSTFIEYQKKLTELRSTLHLKDTSIVEARNTLNSYIKPSHKLSNDVIKMREE